MEGEQSIIVSGSRDFIAGQNVEYIPWSVNLACRMILGMSDAFRDIQLCLAKNLKSARQSAGLSQERLAMDAEIDRTYVSQLERALVNPSLSVLIRLSECLEVSVAELLSDRAH